MSNILITGANGQLGNEFRKLASRKTGDHYFFTDIEDMDITDKQSVDSYVQHNNIQTVINCAAYTAVDKAENDEDTATLINATAVEILANVCEKYQAKLIHISTDYVYDGMACKPYTEDHEVSPLSAYGRSKLAGEKAALTNPETVVIRTSWLYSSFGNNFVKTMLRLGKEKDTLNVVFDQIGTPTYAADLAEVILVIVGKASENKLQRGIYHYSNEGVCSWYDFAHEIMCLSGSKCCVKPIETRDYPTPAARPNYSVLNKTRIKSKYGIDIPHWQDSLKNCLAELQEKVV